MHNLSCQVYSVNFTEKLYFIPFKFYIYFVVLNFYGHTDLKMNYFSYKYQFYIDKYQLENNFLLFLFFFLRTLYLCSSEVKQKFLKFL